MRNEQRRLHVKIVSILTLEIHNLLPSSTEYEMCFFAAILSLVAEEKVLKS